MTDVRGAPPVADDGGLAAFRRWWGDHAIAQAIALAFAVALVAWLAANVVGSMHRLGMAPSLDYLSQPANFDISESLLAYHAGDPYARAMLVGVLNTLKLAIAGCAGWYRAGVWAAGWDRRLPSEPDRRLRLLTRHTSCVRSRGKAARHQCRRTMGLAEPTASGQFIGFDQLRFEHLLRRSRRWGHTPGE